MQENENKFNNILLIIFDIKNEKREYFVSKIFIKCDNGSYEIHIGHIETFLPISNATILIHTEPKKEEKFEKISGIFFFKENNAKIIIDI